MIRPSGLLRDEGGAITIDWIGVSAGILLLSLVALFAGSNNSVSSVIEKMNESPEAARQIPVAASAAETALDPGAEDHPLGY